MYCLLDTGATHSLITYAALQRLPSFCNIDIQPGISLVDVSGNDIDLYGWTELKISGIAQEVAVCHTLQGPDMLLGIEFLRKGNFLFADSIFQLGEKKFPLDCRKEAGMPNQTSIISCLPEATSVQIKELVESFRDVFCDKITPVQLSKVDPAVIDTGDARPIRQKAYRLPFMKRQQADECIDQMLEDGIVEPSSSPWASPITLVPKPDGSTRFCVDYRKLNEVTVKDAYPIPNIQDVLDGLQGAKVFSTLDLKSGYWQQDLRKEDREKSVFITHRGLYQFRRLPFGLANAPSQFQRQMNKVLQGLIGKICLCILMMSLYIPRTRPSMLSISRWFLNASGSGGFSSSKQNAILGFLSSNSWVILSLRKVHSLMLLR